METVKTTDEYTVVKKRSGRYGVHTNAKGKKWLNGDEKVAILVKEGLMKAVAKKAEPVAEEAPAEETKEETAE